jgi:hypothetical protein
MHIGCGAQPSPSDRVLSSGVKRSRLEANHSPQSSSYTCLECVELYFHSHVSRGMLHVQCQGQLQAYFCGRKSNRPTDRPTDRPTNQPTDQPTDPLTPCGLLRIYQRCGGTFYFYIQVPFVGYLICSPNLSVLANKWVAIIRV